MNTNKKTIVYLATYFYPFQGGAENTTLELALQSVKAGYNVHVITSHKQHGHKINVYEEIYKGIKIHRVKTWFRLSLNLVFYPALLPILLKIKADTISVNYLGIIWQDFCLIIKKIISPKTQFINMPIDKFMGHTNYPWYQKIIKVIYLFIQRLFVNWLYDVFIQINPKQYIWLNKDFKIPTTKIHFVSPGIASKDLIKRNPNEVIKKYKLQNKFILSYIGRIEKYKGINQVIKILPQLVKQFPNIIYIVGGKPTKHQHELKILAQKLNLMKNLMKYVIFIDTVSDEKKFEIYATSDIFVSPSSSEGFGITYLEAMSQNNAIITALNEGSKFLIKNGKNGFVCKQDDTDLLKKNIEKLVLDKNLLTKIQNNNLKLVKSYTWNEIYERDYKKILKILKSSL